MNAPAELSSMHQRHQKLGDGVSPPLPQPRKFATLQEERLHRKQMLAASFRLFSRFGFDEGVAGHITARDPEFTDTFWVNPFGMHFSQIKVSTLIRVDHRGNVVEGVLPVNEAAFAIHSRIHHARPDVVAAAHTHAPHGRAWATLGKPLDIISLDSCAFYNDHVVHNDFEGVVLEVDEGDRIANALGKNKGVILQNHGLLTVGDSVEAAAWWYIAMERCCQVQLMAEAASHGKPLKMVNKAAAEQAYPIVGSSYAGWFQFQPLLARISKDQPDLFD
jgi:ribulose-5-phosphate 4-epimerase/fuculose-1-phosphate aldolase